MGTDINLQKVYRDLGEKMCQNTNHDKWIFFIDFKGAYDIVYHQKLYIEMKKIGIDDEIINLVEYLFK